MRLDDQRASSNIEDRRGISMGKGVAGGGIGVVILALVAMFFGVDPSVILQGGLPGTEAPAPTARQQASPPARDDPTKQFVARVLGSTEDVWTEVFGRSNRKYEAPTLVLFSGSVRSACGFAQAAVGPFYCPADRKLYIDLDFLHALQERFRAPGDFAQAYVIAHEVGHHVQNLLGVSERVHGMQQRSDARTANALSVRNELQADCFAGIWASRANQAKRILDEGDIEEGMRAAAAVGDDNIQKSTRGYVSPESFTHGSSQQRVSWFRRGLSSGDLRQCDAFAAKQL